jgi:hypothetical protein
VVLGYLLGTAVLYFDLPSADFMEKAYSAAVALREREFPTPESPATSLENLTSTIVNKDVPGQTCDGFTLYSTTRSCSATLIDMQGNVVHDWALPFSKAFPKAPHLRRPLDDDRIHWFRCHLYPNGDLLAIYHAEGDTPYGYGLVKLDRDSKILWSYAGCVHHDLDVAEDGSIYALTQEFSNRPIPGSSSVPSTYLADSVVVLSSEGTEQKQVSILDSFGGTPFESWLGAFDRPKPKPSFPGSELTIPAINTSEGSTGRLQARKHGMVFGDLLHANSVRVLGPKLAVHFPLFRAGQVLVSLRNLSMLAVLDVETSAVVWASRGPWRSQHDAEFLDNGHLLVFDNLGSLAQSRVIEYDPRTQAVPWCYQNDDSEPFVASLRGTKQRLANGNTLLVDPDASRIIEVTSAKKRVWECVCPVHVKDRPEDSSVAAKITGARRYGAADVPFLSRNKSARPRSSDH